MTTEKNNANETPKTKTPPAWEIFIVGDDGEILKREYTNKATGKTGTAWDKRGALWTGETKGGKATLAGTLRLSDGQEIRLRLFAPRPTKAKKEGK
jgi:hypothetical protein